MSINGIAPDGSDVNTLILYEWLEILVHFVEW